MPRAYKASWSSEAIITRGVVRAALDSALARRRGPQGYDGSGGMAERFKAAVLKTVDGETRPGVRIPLPPPVQLSRDGKSLGIRRRQDARAAPRPRRRNTRLRTLATSVRAAPAEAVIPNGIERISGVMMMASYGPLPANLHAIHWRPALLR